MQGQSSAPGKKASLNLQLKNGFKRGIVRDCAKAGMTVGDQTESEVDVMEQVNVGTTGANQKMISAVLCTFWKTSRCC